jgi:glycosyltransferase involved in cell wall biosynthesis
MNKNIKLKMIGNTNKISYNNSDITLLPFINSKKIAKHLNDAKCLVLPSYEDHWGVVVHEAIRCGCVLILSNSVGSKSEFLKKNGFSFDIKKYGDLSSKMEKILKVSDRELINMSNKSVEISKKRSLKYWNSQFKKILAEIR